MQSFLFIFSAVLLLSGCGHLATAPANHACAAADNATGLGLELVRQQMTAGNYHAALAHLDAIDNQTRSNNLPQALLLRARAARAIGDADGAAASFQKLLDTCLAAYAHQGLGTLAADRRDLPAALAQLREARQLAPADASIRNDYGFVLLAAGRVDESLREFRTAVELESGDALALRNLVLALFIAQQDNAARACAAQHALDAAEIDQLAARARNFHPLPPSPAEKSADATT
jgi:Flp pilus assembly protein TadD